LNRLLNFSECGLKEVNTMENLKMVFKIRHLYFLFVSLILLLSACIRTGRAELDGEKVREYANALYNNELYQQAVEEYRHYLDIYPLDIEKRANIWFTIGNIYFDRINDYEKALAFYLKIKTLCPDSPVMQDTEKKIVACLERLQRSSDAKLALNDAVNFKSGLDDTGRPGDVVAKVGDKTITSGDLDFYLSRVPDYIKNQIKDRESKKNFLVQYIATELFYDAAKRAGYDKDKDVIEGTFQAKKSLMVQKYLEKEIPSGENISADDVELYYKANKDKYTEKDKDGKIKRIKTLNEVKQEVARDLLMEKQKKAYSELLQRMMQAEDVKIFDDKIK